MAVPDELYETVNDAVQALARAARRWGAEAVRDAISEARDTPDEDATPFDDALYDTVADALSQAEDVTEGRSRIAILTPDGARVTWSWSGGAQPDQKFETMVLDSVGRALVDLFGG